MDNLSQWSADCLAELLVDHEREAFLKFVLLARIIGYQHAALGFEVPSSVAQPHYSFFSTYPADWQDKFVSADPRHHGSKVAHGKRSIEPAPGTDPYFWTRSDFDREAEAHRIVYDWQETYSCAYGSTAFVALSAPAGPVSAPARRILVAHTVDAMARILVPKALPHLPNPEQLTLTDLERRCLRWVLDGKTVSEIAQILNTKESRIENLQRRLSATFAKKGISATAFLAYRLGLLAEI